MECHRFADLIAAAEKNAIVGSYSLFCTSSFVAASLSLVCRVVSLGRISRVFLFRLFDSDVDFCSFCITDRRTLFEVKVLDVTLELRTLLFSLCERRVHSLAVDFFSSFRSENDGVAVSLLQEVKTCWPTQQNMYYRWLLL